MAANIFISNQYHYHGAELGSSRHSGTGHGDYGYVFRYHKTHMSLGTEESPLTRETYDSMSGASDFDHEETPTGDFLTLLEMLAYL